MVSNHTCRDKIERLRVKHIHFHPDGGYIYQITFTDADKNIMSAFTHFYKLSDKDILQLNELISVGNDYLVKYAICQGEVKKYHIDGFYFC